MAISRLTPLHAQARCFIARAAPLGLLLISHCVVYRWMKAAGHLASASYTRPVLAVELMARLATDTIFLIAMLLLLATRWRQLWHNWDSFDYGRQARSFILVVAGVAAWSFSTYEYNLYFDQGHYLDRTLLVGFVLLIGYRPIFLLPFILLLNTVVWQFDYPLIGQYPWTEMNLVTSVLTLSLVAFLLHVITGSRQTAYYIFMLICLLATTYWWGGFNKLWMGWPLHGHLYLMTLSAYANGWLGRAAPETIVAYAHILRWFDWPMILFTLLVEFAIIGVLLKRSMVLLSLGGWIIFHLAVFATTGMFFWKWIAIEAALLAWFVRSDTLKTLPIFTPTYFILSVIVIAGGVVWTRPTNLSWFDTPMCYTYRFEAVSESSKRYPLPTATFGPYADTFTLGNFGYLNPRPQVIHIWGVTQHRTRATAMLKITSPDQAIAFESEHGQTMLNPDRAKHMDDFIQRFFAHLNEHGAKPTGPSWLQAPRHLWNTSPHRAFTGQEKIVQVEVYHVTTFYDGYSYKQIRKYLVRQIDIPRGSVNTTAQEQPARGLQQGEV